MDKMISLEKCQKILNEEGSNYTIEETKKIREVLYRIGRVEVELYNEREESGDPLLQGVDRRSGGRVLAEEPLLAHLEHLDRILSLRHSILLS